MVKKRKRWGIVLLITIVSIMVIVIIGGYMLFKDEIKAVSSIKKLKDGLWYIEYDGEYGFDDFIKKGGASTDEEMGQYIASFISKGFYKSEYDTQKGNYNCSTIAAKTSQGAYVFGRNFDWDNCKCMIVKTNPKKGYKSISTVNLDFLGFGDGYIPDKDMESSFMALAAVYVPLDGMNEKGLCIADLVVGDGEFGTTHQDTNKADITTVSAIRLILDHAADVNEAIELLKKYDMNSSAGMMHHFSISDASGHSVVVEYIDNQMFVTPTQQVTNFYLTKGDHYGLGGDSAMSLERYNILNDTYNNANGIMSMEDIKEALISVSCGTLSRGNTQWSIVYDKSSLNLEFWFREDYNNRYSFSI